MAGHPQRGDARQGAGRVQFHQQHVARVIGLEAIRLGRAAVPGAGIDLSGAVPVAQGQVIEPRAGGAIGSDGVGRVRLFGQDPAHAAVRQADAQQPRRRFPAVEGGAEVIVHMALGEWRGQHRQTGVGQFEYTGLQRQHHVGGHDAHARGARPHAFGQRGVVVAG